MFHLEGWAGRTWPSRCVRMEPVMRAGRQMAIFASGILPPWETILGHKGHAGFLGEVWGMVFLQWYSLCLNLPHKPPTLMIFKAQLFKSCLGYSLWDAQKPDYHLPVFHSYRLQLKPTAWSPQKSWELCSALFLSYNWNASGSITKQQNCAVRIWYKLNRTYLKIRCWGRSTNLVVNTIKETHGLEIFFYKNWNLLGWKPTVTHGVLMNSLK